jgi:hypothetical protein
MFTREFLQAVSDWQRGGDENQKTRRGERLKELAESIDQRFRQCASVTYRQVALAKGGVWKLIAEKTLSESISGWTLSPAVAKTFKGGVPPEGWQGVIFAIKPQPQNVIIDLNSLYVCPEFQEALEREKGVITGFADGAGRYRNTQAEVILNLDSLEYADLHALGGYSSDRDTLIRMMFNGEPTPELIAWFEHNRRAAGVALGPVWLEGDPLQRVLKRMEPHVARLKPIKAAQDDARVVRSGDRAVDGKL